MSLIKLRVLCRPRHSVRIHFKQYASSREIETTTIENENVEPPVLADENTQEDIIEKLRNKSKLGEKHYNKFYNKAPLLSEDEKLVFPLSRLRRIYGQHGSSSGIDFGLLWPSKEELELKKEWESVAFPNTLPQMMEMAKRSKEEEEQKILQREEEITQKIAKLEGWKKEVRDRIAKQEREAYEAKEKKERVMEEVRQMFGFRIDPKDVRFQEALAKKEEEEKRAAKAAKKLKKQQKIIENIKKMAQKASSQDDESKGSGEGLQGQSIVPESQPPPVTKS